AAPEFLASSSSRLTYLEVTGLMTPSMATRWTSPGAGAIAASGGVRAGAAAANIERASQSANGRESGRPMLALELDEAGMGQLDLFQQHAFEFAEDLDDLVSAGPDRHDQQPLGPELLDQRVGDPGRRGRDHDGVEGGLFGPAQRAVAC